jgi:undecaprenyl-diphosphatase
MSEFLQAAILGLVEGLTEFLPVSSTGHLILAREIFGVGAAWPAATGLAFDAVVQTATALAIVLFYRRDIWELVKSFVLHWWLDRRTLRNTPLSSPAWRTHAEVICLFSATLPALVLGLTLEGAIESSFRGVGAVIWGLLLGTALLALAEILVAKRAAPSGAPLTWRRALVVGVFQALALLPGVSRSGSTIAGGVVVGQGRAEAARFAFLLGVPILFGAGLKKLLDLAQSGLLATLWQPLLVASVVGVVSGYLAIGILTRYLSTRTLWPFVWYRLALAAALLVWVV